VEKVEEFFHHIGPQIISLSGERFKKTKKLTYKNPAIGLDIATEGDLDTEEFIKMEIAKWFPKDKIVAEETSSNVEGIKNGRAWIIDPICGSANFKNGIKFFSTNIALASDGKLIASCVVDHSRKKYIWSTGGSKIFINNKKVNPEKKTKGIMIEVDLTGIAGTQKQVVNRHLKLLTDLLHNKSFYLSTFCTSLPFAYVSLGRVDAYVNGYSHVWDVAAANFLIMQAGGTVSQLDGSVWNLSSDNCMGTLDKSLHSELLSIINS
jgi:myo-inositol-1(or 4)-monophosphatase